MAATVRRHLGNYAAAMAVLFLAAAGLDALLMYLGGSPLFGCLVRPWLYLVLAQGLAVNLITVGVLLALLPATRPIGATLLVGGVLIGVLPQLLEGYLAPLCRSGH